MTPHDVPCPRCDGPLVEHCPGKANVCRWQRCRKCDLTLDLPKMRGYHTKTGEFLKLGGPEQQGGPTAGNGPQAGDGPTPTD